MFRLTALGGTFDIIHMGHIGLIGKAVSISEKIIIGLTSDEFISKHGKKINNNFEQRFENLEKMIHENFPNCSFEIAKLDDDFGPAVIEGDVDALVVSEETRKKGDILNLSRKERICSKVFGSSFSILMSFLSGNPFLKESRPLGPNEKVIFSDSFTKARSFRRNHSIPLRI